MAWCRKRGSIVAYDVTRRNQVLRKAERGRYDEEAVHAIVDAAMVGHVGHEIDGQQYAIPTMVAHDGDSLLLHGASKSRTILHAGAGNPLCVTVMITDRIVLARSAFTHSINYRAAVIYGMWRLVTDPDEKLAVLVRFTKKLLPGCWDDTRPTTAQELKATGVVVVPIEQASMKVRGGMPIDEPEDVGLPIWGGIIPVRQVLDDPISDQHVAAGMPVPEYLQEHVARSRSSLVGVVADSRRWEIADCCGR